MTVKIASALPATVAANGLHVIERQLVADPDETHIVIAVIRTKAITTTLDADGADKVPTAKIVHIERAGSINVARELLVEAHSTRTGMQTLPFEREDGADEF
jgi:hypothetical protein